MAAGSCCRQGGQRMRKIIGRICTGVLSASLICAGLSAAGPVSVHASDLTGWNYNGYAWNYYYDDGSMATGWVCDNGTWYYLNPDGSMAAGWVNIDNTWYYLYGSGAMATGWVNDNGTWYYLNPDGSMAVGWVLDNGSWYYMNPDGSMTVGWKQVGGTWYYFEESGAMAASCWVGNYYLKGNGAMAADQWIGSYYVGGDGSWIPGYSEPSVDQPAGDEAVVYWVPDGEVYHLRRDCRTIRESSDVQSGTIVQSGKVRACKICGGK